jgi:hypothetical protein
MATGDWRMTNRCCDEGIKIELPERRYRKWN